MDEKIKKHTVISCWIIFAILILVRTMADHFFNNCIATNLLHVITETGTDEMMIIRVAIAQLLSFTVVLLVWKKNFCKSHLPMLL